MHYVSICKLREERYRSCFKIFNGIQGQGAGTDNCRNIGDFWEIGSLTTRSLRSRGGFQNIPKLYILHADGITGRFNKARIKPLSSLMVMFCLLN